MPKSLLFLEYLKVLVWPLTLLVVVIILRKNLRGVLDRIRKISYKDVSAELGAQVRSQEKAMKQPRAETGLSSKQKKSLAAKADTVGSIKPPRKATETKKVIAQANEEIAVRDTLLDFERIYNVIFGSQIQLLLDLNANKDGLPIENTDAFFNKIMLKWRPNFTDWGFDKYMSYLLSTGLVEIYKNNAFITEKGQAFLNYLISQRYNLNKDL